MAALLALVASPSIARADAEDRLYDFTDEFYRQNGVDPSKIVGRRQGDGRLGVFDTPNYSFQRNVRALLTLPAYNHSGNPVYWTVMGELFNDGFTDDEAGRRARQTADNMIEYVFPAKGTNPVGLGAMRQSVLLDMRNGYFSNNPLGLWIHVWINYTDKAFNTTEGKAVLADLGRRNGLALDGTPMIRSTSEIDNLYSKGLVTKTTVPNESPIRYGICPVIKDPTDGGIAQDQFLITPRRSGGDALIPSIQRNFDNLRINGDWL